MLLQHTAESETNCLKQWLDEKGKATQTTSQEIEQAEWKKCTDNNNNDDDGGDDDDEETKQEPRDAKC